MRVTLGVPSPLSLRANFVWTFLGNSTYALSQWAILVVLAKLGSVEIVGQFSLGLAITAPVVLFCSLNLRALQATDARDAFEFEEYLGLRMLSVGVALLIVLAIVGFGRFRMGTALVVLAVGVAKAFEAVGDVIHGLLQRHERMDRIGLSLGARGIVSLATIAIAMWLTGSVVWAAMTMAATWGVWLLTYDLRNARAFGGRRPKLGRRALCRLLRLALPLGIVMLLLSLNSSVPRYFIEGLYGERELGYFSALAYLMVAGNTVVAALGQSASPRLAQYFVEQRRRAFVVLLSKLLCAAVAVGVVGISAAALAGRRILELLYAPDYGDRTELLVWLMVVALVNYVGSLLGYAMTAQRRFKEQMVLFLGVFAVLTAACAVLVPGRGVIGAAQAALAAGCVQVVGAAGIGIHALQLAGRAKA